MSWCRFASHCQNGIGSYMDLNNACVNCPGSDLYIFDNVDGHLECCMCLLGKFEDDTDVFQTKEYAEMLAHVEKHIAAGHHVRPSLVACLRANVTEGRSYAKDMAEMFGEEAAR